MKQTPAKTTHNLLTNSTIGQTSASSKKMSNKSIIGVLIMHWLSSVVSNSIDCSDFDGTNKWFCEKKGKCQWEESSSLCYGTTYLTCGEGTSRWMCNNFNKKKSKCKWVNFMKACLGNDEVPSCSKATKYWPCNKIKEMNPSCKWSYPEKTCISEAHDTCETVVGKKYSTRTCLI